MVNAVRGARVQESWTGKDWLRRQMAVELYGRLADMASSFDAWWQRLGSATIFEAAWEMVVQADLIRNKPASGRHIDLHVAELLAGKLAPPDSGSEE